MASVAAQDPASSRKRGPGMLIKVGTVLIAALMALSCLATLTGISGLALFTDQNANTGNIFTTAASFPTDTGYRSPSADAADTGGDGNGFELDPTNAYTDASGYASNINGALDRHRYYDYNIAVDSGSTINGIRVRVDWWLDGTGGDNSMSVELSWDGGTSWTAPKADATETTSEHTAILGGAADIWGRLWTGDDLSNANFRVRLTCNCLGGAECDSRDYYLDWVAVNVFYTPS